MRSEKEISMHDGDDTFPMRLAWTKEEEIEQYVNKALYCLLFVPPEHVTCEVRQAIALLDVAKQLLNIDPVRAQEVAEIFTAIGKPYPKWQPKRH
jgi:hypothetical protein